MTPSEDAPMAELCCKHCGGASFVRNGMAAGHQRYRCKACGRNFTATPARGKPPAMKALAVLLYALGNVSQGMIAKLLGVSHVAVYKWVRAAGEGAPDWYARMDREFAPPGVVNYNWSEVTAAFLQGQVAFMEDGINFLSQYEDETKSKVKGKVGYMLVPKAPAARSRPPTRRASPSARSPRSRLRPSCSRSGPPARRWVSSRRSPASAWRGCPPGTIQL